jgi:hypothetical protein
MREGLLAKLQEPQHRRGASGGNEPNERGRRAHSIESDLRSRTEPTESLALSMIATIVPDSLVNTVADTIIEIAVNNKVSTTVRKKAVL